MVAWTRSDWHQCPTLNWSSCWRAYRFDQGGVKAGGQDSVGRGPPDLGAIRWRRGCHLDEFVARRGEKTLQEIHGLGAGIAAMATRILHDDFECSKGRNTR